MSELQLDERYWEQRWQEGATGWDIGYASTPIKDYFDQLPSKGQRILIPGCGNGWEGEYLFRNGFERVYMVDISASAIERFAQRVPDFPTDQLIHGDFFALKESFDILVEQTFFCALHPSQRDAYIQEAHELLHPEGRLVGLLFNIPLYSDHPPYGGDEAEYRERFSKYFHIHTMEVAHNSIKPRQGNELFINLKAKD